MLVLAACGRPGPFAPSAVQVGGDAPDPGYRPPPVLGGMIRAADGAVSLSGRAMPSSKVRMVSSSGVQIETTADGKGAWTARLGPVSEPTLYRLAAEAGDHQRVEAEGYVAVLPGGPTAVLLRAGAGAQVQDAGSARARILAIDIDAGGTTVVSGRAHPTAPVRVMVDGGLAIEGAAGPDGRFSLTLPKPLAEGPRKLQVVTPAGSAGAEVDVAPPRPPAEGPFQAVAEPLGWRLEWLTPGGGPQTTLLIGAAVPPG